LFQFRRALRIHL